MTRFPRAAIVVTLVLATVGCSAAAAPGAPAPGSGTPAAQQIEPPGSLVASTAGAAAASAPSSLAASPGELDRTVERYWEAYLELNPLRATASGDHDHDERLENSISPQYLADSLALERRALAELLSTPAPPETTPAGLTYELFKRGRELSIEGYL